MDINKDNSSEETDAAHLKFTVTGESAAIT